MPASTLTFDDVLPRIAEKGVARDEDSHLEMLIDPSNGQQAGFLVESTFERVVIAKHDQIELSLEHISRIRQMIVRARARRGLLYVPVDARISNPVMLLATLSRIEIVRLVGQSEA